VVSRVRRILRSRGAPPSSIDDALQTAAERALCRPGGFDSVDGCVHWTTKVAWHEIECSWRRQAKAVAGEVPERAGGADPAAVVEGRLALEATIEGLAGLTDSDRQTILSSLDDADLAAAPLSAAEKMRRYRVRRKLAASLAGWNLPGT
jgi:DNA-directed RNA polymerase specialized sigma24 family protein